MGLVDLQEHLLCCSTKVLVACILCNEIPLFLCRAKSFSRKGHFRQLLPRLCPFVMLVESGSDTSLRMHSFAGWTVALSVDPDAFESRIW